MALKLDELSIDIILIIFSFCDIQGLCKLKETCKLFNRIITTSLHMTIKNDLLVTNQRKLQLRQRTYNLLNAYEKCRISHNWMIGRYAEKSYLYENERFMPWLHLTKDHIWISRGKSIRGYRRRRSGVDVRKAEYILAGETDADICKFTFKNDHVIAGQSDGNFWCWSFSNKCNLFNVKHHNLDVNSTDFNHEIIATGSKDGTVILWPFQAYDSTLLPKNIFNLNDRVLALSLNDNNSLAVGTSGYGYCPLSVYDTNTCNQIHQLGSNFRRGSGILDMKWDNPQCLYTCGYDMQIRKWDMRTGSNVQSWDDPFLSTVYCMDTDNCYTIISGTSTYGRAVLWDARTKRCVQVYFMNTSKRRGLSSPVYSLSFDSSHLVTATDLYLHLLDFSVKKSCIKNYNICYRKEIIAYS